MTVPPSGPNAAQDIGPSTPPEAHPNSHADSHWPIGKKSAYFTLAITMTLGVFDFIDRQVMAALLPYIKAEYTLSDVQLGMLISIVNFSMALLVIPSAYFIDRWSRKKMMALMAFVWSIATGACAFAGSYTHLLIARFFIGAGEAGYNPAGQSLLAASFPKNLRTTVIAALQFSMGIGAPIGLIVGAYVAQQWGWRHAFGIVAIPGILASFLALAVKDFKTVAHQSHTPQEANAKAGAEVGAQSEAGDNEPYWRVIVSLLCKPTLICVFIAQSCVLLMSATLMNWLPSYLNREAAMSVTMASTVSAVYMLGTSAATLLCGPLFDRMRSVRVTSATFMQAWAALLGFVLIYYVFAWATPGSTSQIVVLILHTFLTCPLVSLGYTLTTDLSLPHQRATAVSLLVSVQNIFGMGFGPLLAGFLSDAFSLGTGLLFMGGFYALAGLLYFVVTATYDRDLSRMKQVVVKF